MNEGILETFNQIQTKINQFQAKIQKINIEEAAGRSQIIEYHYKTIIRNLKQIIYHMEKIQEPCQLPPVPQKPPRFQVLQKRIVENRIRQFDSDGKSQLSSCERDLWAFRSARNLRESKKPLAKSMDNLSRKRLSFAVYDIDKNLSLENLLIDDAKSKELLAFDQEEDDASSRKPKIVALHPKRGAPVELVPGFVYYLD